MHVNRRRVPRALTDAQARHQAWLRQAADLLDNAFRVPVIGTRVGWDPVVGLIPVLGDLVTPAFGVLVLLQAMRLGIPKVVQLRMVGNMAVDFVGGLVPLLGDLFDAAWKANAANMALLERHAYEIRRASVGDWLFVVGLIAIVIAIAVVPLLLFTWLIHLLGRHLF